MTFGASPIKIVPISLVTLAQSQQTAFSPPATYLRWPTLTTALAALSGTRFRLQAADHVEYPGTPQFRILGQFGDDGGGGALPATNDNMQIAVYDAVNALVVVSASALVASPGGTNVVTRALSAWTNVPTLTYCYLQAANLTVARGAIIEAHYEVRWV